jgi:hypothetical protein
LKETALRIALAGFNLESVSFLPTQTTIAEFEHFEAQGDAISQKFCGTNTVTGGARLLPVNRRILGRLLSFKVGVLALL